MPKVTQSEASELYQGVKATMCRSMFRKLIESFEADCKWLEAERCRPLLDLPEASLAVMWDIICAAARK